MLEKACNLLGKNVKIKSKYSLMHKYSVTESSLILLTFSCLPSLTLPSFFVTFLYFLGPDTVLATSISLTLTLSMVNNAFA